MLLRVDLGRDWFDWVYGLRRGVRSVFAPEALVWDPLDGFLAPGNGASTG